VRGGDRGPPAVDGSRKHHRPGGRNAARAAVKRRVCTSVSCSTAEKYDAGRLCAGYRSVYNCCPECQRDDWKGHTPACTVATAEREASQLVRVGKGGGSAPAAAAPERVGPPASHREAGTARGEAEALYEVGWCYHNGEGAPQSWRTANRLTTGPASTRARGTVRPDLAAVLFKPQR
jgi:hypothetical protein